MFRICDNVIDTFSRSDYLNGHTLHGRDSGTHSNSTEEDNLISARALSKTRKRFVLFSI